jgi:hypothetical protein
VAFMCATKMRINPLITSWGRWMTETFLFCLRT